MFVEQCLFFPPSLVGFLFLFDVLATVVVIVRFVVLRPAVGLSAFGSASSSCCSVMSLFVV